MVSALQRLTPTDYRIEAAIKAVNRRTGRPAKMTAIRGALNFTVSVSTVRRGIWRLEDAGLIYRFSTGTGYLAGKPPARVSTRHQPLRTAESERAYRWRTETMPMRQTELRLLVEVGRQPAAPAKPARAPKRGATPADADAPRQLALPIADAA